MALPNGWILDHRLLAGITLVGMFLDIVGALYLAYELLGDRFGVLRGVTLTLTFGMASCVALAVGMSAVAWIVAGPRIGLLGALGGGAVGLSAATVAAAVVHGLRMDLNGGVVNGLKAAIAGALSGALGGGLMFGMPGILIYMPAAATLAVCAFGVRGTVRGGVTAAIFMTLLVGGAATVTDSLFSGIIYGPVIGLAGGILAGPGRHILSWSDNLPGRSMGVAGAVLIFLGFLVQSLQYWVVVLNVPVR